MVTKLAAVLSCRVEEATVFFSGILVDHSLESHLRESASQAKESKAFDKRLRIDFGDLERANSLGIRAWIEAVTNLNTPVTYVRLCRSLVESAALLTEFYRYDMTIESVMVPFFCEKTEDTVQIPMVVGKDIPFLDNYDTFEPVLDLNGEKYILDGDPRAYFLFMSLVKEKHLKAGIPLPG